MTIRARLLNAAADPGVEAEGNIVYDGSVGNTDATYIQHPTDRGTEDFIAFDSAPSSPQIEYDVTLESGVSAVRFLGDAIEFVDQGGAPRLRMDAPLLEDATGQVAQAAVAVSGCTFDSDPRGPWGRQLAAPGATSCRVKISWSNVDVAYPLLVDPSWLATGTMNAASRRYHAASLLQDGRVLVSGGSVSAPTNQTGMCELYDPSTNSWASTGSLGRKRRDHTSTTLPSGKVAAVGGVSAITGNGPENWLDLYDPATGTWTQSPAMVSNRIGHSATFAYLTGKLLVAGGQDGSIWSSSELYDFTTNTWSAGPGMSVARTLHAAALLDDGRVLLAGGYNTASTLTATGQIYNPLTNSWTAAGNLGTARANFTLSPLASGLVLAVGGAVSGGYTATAELYTPTTNLFTPSAHSLAAARSSHRAVVLGRNRLMVIGGTNSGGALSTTEVFDVFSNAWSTQAALPSAKLGHEALLVPAANKVLTIGAGSTETWGAPPPSGDGGSAMPVTVEWQVTAGNKAANDSLSAKITNRSGADKSVTLKVLGSGLDGRDVSRTISTQTVTSTLVVNFPASNLPVQSVGTQSEGTLEVEFTNHGVTAHSWSLPLFYQFASGYSNLTVYGASPLAMPDFSNPGAMFGLVGGEVTVEYDAYFSALTNAVSSLFTLNGRVWNGAAFDEIASLPRQGGTGATAWGSGPLDPNFSTVGRWLNPNGTLPPESGAIPYVVCVNWGARYYDAGYGEDRYTNTKFNSVPAAYGQIDIVRRSTGKRIYYGNLTQSGCGTINLVPSADYILLLYSSIRRPDGATIDAVYRESHAPPFGTPPPPPHYAFPLKTFIGSNPQDVGIIANDTLTMSFGFTVKPTTGTVILDPWYSDMQTRVLASLATIFAQPGNSLVTNKGYFAYTDTICPDANQPASSCYHPLDESFHVGPGPDTVHDSYWKFIVAHEFGHNVASFLFGDFAHSYTRGGSTGTCSCDFVGPNVAPGPALTALRLHCLNSVEFSDAAQKEGYAHYFATQTWNDLTQSDCNFVYYKDSANQQNVVESPPASRDCRAQVRWDNQHCGGRTVGQGGDGSGVEWDWMNTFIDITTGSNPFSGVDIRDSYQQACAGTNPPRMCDGNDLMSYTTLRDGVVAKFGATSTQLAKFDTAATFYGTND